MKEIVIISRCKHEQFLSAVLTNSQRPVVGCLNVGAGILARSERVSKGTGADKRFVKTALKNAELHLLMITISFNLISVIYIKGY